MEQITLYYSQGASDKVYQAQIEPKDGGFVVNFQFGRRGTTLQTGTKTNSPVPHDTAKRIFDKLVSEKTAKGYTPGQDGTPYQQTDKADRASGIHCQLLNSVEEDDLAELIASPEYWMQEKFDGRRMLIEKKEGTVTGINRLGLRVSLPKIIHDDAAQCPIGFILDGEAVGDVLQVFDVLSIGQEDLHPLLYLERHLRLMNLLASFRHPSIQLVHTTCTGDEKSNALDELKAKGGEGVVFKKIDQPYTAGRPASGGPALKFKFHETASFIVGGINAKRSVSLSLVGGDQIKSAGNVTIPPNHEIPAIGNIVEVRYLYAFRESGHIYQPVYLGKREDIPKEECTVDQLKFKT